jgi:hypothetical protein
VRGVIYCEDCLGAKMEGTAPPASPGFVSGTVPPAAASGRVSQPPPAGSGSGPNPTVAGILAGFFPFGVGAVYTGQYAKGLAHLAIFGLLVAGCNVASNSSHGEALGAICGIGLAFFYVYQIVDAVRSARAIQAGLPAPDPYGLAATFGGGAKVDTTKIPFGAIILILIGVLFLLHTMGLEFGLDRFWPLILIVAGGWMFARNWGLTGEGVGSCQCARCRARRLMGPAVVLTLGFLFLFESLGSIGFGRTWPVLLLVIGGIKLLQSTASTQGHNSLPPSAPGPPAAADTGAPPDPSTTPGEVSHG